MKLTNFKIDDLITLDAKLTFLVGAGCSVDPPSNLPAGKAMMDAIITYTCAESEIDKLLGNVELSDGKKLEGLRFEQLIEIIGDELDPDLKVIDFYGLCDKPNLQHFFLAEMIRKGQYVLTTNFDFLIEHAILQSGVPKEEIKVIITKEDFEKFYTPQNLYLNGLKSLYKIHGSTKNIVTGIPTRDSLIATIQAFGANKEGENVFQLESFKQPAFVNLTKNRSLVIMGYSGSDDFDIVPTLKILKDIQDIIWINYVHDDRGNELIYEIDMKDTDNYKELPKVDQILVDIKRMNNVKRVFRVDVNTMRMVKDLLPNKTEVKSDEFFIDVYDWLLDNIKPPGILLKLYIPYKIYQGFNIYTEAMSLLEEIFSIAERNEEKGKGWKALALHDMGLIYKKQGNYSEALKRYEEALRVDEQLGDVKRKATVLHSIGSIYHDQGKYPEALELYEEALNVAVQIENLKQKANFLNSIGFVYYTQGNYPEALKRYEKTLGIAEQLGDLSGKAIYLNNIGSIYLLQGNYPEALKRFEEALRIDDQLGNLSGKAIGLNNIAQIFETQENYPEALKRYEEALQIAKQTGDLSNNAVYLNNIGEILRTQEKYPEALKRYEEALQIADRLRDLAGKSNLLNNIGLIYYAQENYPEALKRYEVALQIVEQLEKLDIKVNVLNNIGGVFKMQGNYPEALKRYEEALLITEELGNLNRKALILNNFGEILRIQGKYLEALKYFKESLDISEQLELLPKIALSLLWIGTIYGDLKDTSEALQNFERALQIYEQLGDVKTKASVLHSIGEILRTRGKYPEALTCFKESLEINEQLESLPKIALSLLWIGSIYEKLKDTSKALQNLERALKIYEQLGLKKEIHQVRNIISEFKSKR